MNFAPPNSEFPGGSISAQRCHGLDWLRAVAALLVVALHAGIAYTLSPFPGLAWPTHDPHPSAAVDALTWWINGWIMPAFFMMGGFVAAPLLERLGPVEFVRHRARRLLVPLLLGCVAILPLDLYVWLLGWVIDDRIPIKKLRSLKLGPEGEGLWGVAHLWFLQYLFLYSAAAAAWVAWKNGRRIDRASQCPAPGRPSELTAAPLAGEYRSESGTLRIAGVQPGARQRAARRQKNAPRRPAVCWSQTAIHLLAPLLFAIPGALVLAWQPRIVIGFRHSWHPLAANLLYYAPCFAAGWWLQRCARRGHGVTRGAPLHLGVSCVVFALLLPLLRQHVAAEWGGGRLLLLTSMFSVFAWLTAWSAICLALRPCGPAPRAIQYLSAASLWVYLIHHPAVGLAQIALIPAPLTAGARFCLVFTAATCLSLLTYEAFVRRSWMGSLLGGPRERSHPALRSDPPLEGRAAA